MAKSTTKSQKSAATKSKTVSKTKSAKSAKTTQTQVGSAKTNRPGKLRSITLPNLNNWNKLLALLHLAQGIAILLLARDVSVPVSTNFLTLDTLATEASGAPVLSPAVRHLFDVNLAYLAAAFFFLSAIAHGIVATVYRKTYEANLARGINKARWYEYALSASTMMMGIALLSGVYSFTTLFAIFVLTAVMNLMGLVMEVHNQTTAKTNWLSYIVGCIAGLAPWLIIAEYFRAANMYGSGQIPTFVYWIYASIFVFFMSFAVNMYLQYRGRGKWADYLYGERNYMILSLVAKSALAWQLFFGALRP